ncbi:MAG TPA: hypothetical protein VKA48_07520 [Gammaproteobacteria bacterium]|nr:hypothetical protein [Gammaproteobacteria bacterium]
MRDSGFPKRPVLGLGALLLALSLAACGQNGNNQSKNKDTLGADAVNEIVLAALPKWDKSILDVKDRTNWASDLTFAGIADAMQDSAPTYPTNDETLPPADAHLVQDASRSIQMHPTMGSFRYANRDRGWNYKTASPKLPIDKATALGLVKTAAKTLNIPAGELAGKDIVRTQIAAGTSNMDPVDGPVKFEDRFEMYRVVTLKRQINQLPVMGSRIRGAVGLVGEATLIQRMYAHWPAFKLTPNLAVPSQKEVARIATQEILDRDPSSDLQVKAQLAYVPKDLGDEKITFSPAVVLWVDSGETPFMVTVDFPAKG